MPSATIAFNCFPHLPLELQRQVWYHAAKQVRDDGHRIHLIAPEYAYATRTPEFRILCHHPSKVPSLLHVCREARNSALQEYTLWPCARAKDNRRDGTGIYVNKTHDIFYFGNASLAQFEFLDRIIEEEDNFRGQTEEKVLERRGLILEYVHWIEGIRHFALDWEVWYDILPFDYNPARWIRYLSDMEDLTIVLNSPPFWSNRKWAASPTFIGLQPDSIRAQCADIISPWIDNDLDIYQKENPHRVRPNLQVVTLYDDQGDNHSSKGDRVHLDIINKQLLSYREEVDARASEQ